MEVPSWMNVWMDYILGNSFMGNKIVICIISIFGLNKCYYCFQKGIYTGLFYCLSGKAAYAATFFLLFISMLALFILMIKKNEKWWLNWILFSGVVILIDPFFYLLFQLF